MEEAGQLYCFLKRDETIFVIFLDPVRRSGRARYRDNLQLEGISRHVMEVIDMDSDIQIFLAHPSELTEELLAQEKLNSKNNDYVPRASRKHKE